MWQSGRAGNFCARRPVQGRGLVCHRLREEIFDWDLGFGERRLGHEQGREEGQEVGRGEGREQFEIGQRLQVGKQFEEG